MYYDTTMAGFGGQGILLIGNLLAYAAMTEGKNVTYMPTYGVEMRGGTANCTVVVADAPIGSPIIGNPMSALVMNKPSLARFGPKVQTDGFLIINSSLIDGTVEDRPDLTQIRVPANDIAADLGNDKMANMIALGVFLKKTGLVDLASIERAFTKVLASRHHHLIEKNLEMIDEGMEFAVKNGG